MVSKPVKRFRTEEPYEGNLHVRDCGEGAGKPVPLPGTLIGMLLTPLIDAPGALHHIICRGIEGRNIFKGNTDRNRFLERLGSVLQKTFTPATAGC